MQPNQNMPGAGQAMGPARPVAPAGPAKPVNPINPVSPVKPAEPAGGPTFGNGPSVVEGKGGKKTGWILGLVFLAILAAGGIGFGVWAWMDGNTQKDTLNSQISSLKQQNNSLQSQIADLQSTIDDSGNDINGEDSDGDEGNGSTETILAEWGDAKAEAIDGVFYIKNKDGNIAAQDNSVKVVEIVSCDSGTVSAPSPLICNVTTTDGQGKFVYNYDDGSLKFTATSK